MASVADLIHGSYITIFNRAADPQGALFWSQNLGFANIGAAAAAPGNLALADQLGAFFYAAASAIFDSLYSPDILDSEFIDAVYTNLGNSPADLQGAAFWGNRLTTLEGTNSQQVARSIVATEIAFTLQSYDPNATGDAKVRADTYKNKLAVSEAIANTGNPVFNPVSQNSSDPAYAAEVNAVSHVDGTPASLSMWLHQIQVADQANNPALLLPVGGPLTLTVNVDTLSTSFKDAVFTAPSAQNVKGPSNALNVGDNLQDTGTNGTLNYTAVASVLGNPALAAGVTMNGIANANILNTSAGVAGFSGAITGLTTANVVEGSKGNVLLGLASAGLNTALANIGTSAGSNLTAWIVAAALSAADNSVNVNLHGNNLYGSSSLDLLVTGGGNNGYETADIISAGGANTFAMDVNYTSLARINVRGSQALTMNADSTALNISNLHTFDGTQAKGPLKIAFGGTGNVAVDGGSNNDRLTFPATDSVITARGNAGDDTFEFLATNGGATTFNNLDSVDGGTGTNRLILEADNGQLLWAGVGEKILNIGTIQHNSVGTTNGTVSANMGQSGSATVLQLNGQYGGNDVAITNLVTGKSVLFTGSLIDDLNMDATNLVGVINLTMAQTAVGGTQEIKSLNITVGHEVSLTSAGNAALNVIDGADNINANMAISGSKELHLGLEYAYDFAGGIINAIQQGVAGSIGLQIGLGNGAQTLTLGVGNDLVFERTFDAGDLIQLGPLATGGTDIVRFQSTFGNAGLSINGGNYHTITGFNVANDVIQLDVPAISLEKTNNTAVSNPPATFLSSIGQSVDLSANFIDMIKYNTAISGNLTAHGYFDAAIGAGTITVNADANEILFSLYNNDSQQMMLFTVDPQSAGAANQITAADDVDMVAVVGMSFADFQTFGNDGSLVFV